MTLLCFLKDIKIVTIKYKKYEKRGMFLEDLINRTISFYKHNDIAIINKKNLDIAFSTVKNIGSKQVINNGYVKSKSTSDYYGIYKGKFIAFEAKSTNLKSLPLKNIKQHQLDYLWKIHRHKGVAFLIIYFSEENRIFIIFVNDLELLPKNKKSIPIAFVIEHGIETSINYPGIIDFIDFLV